MAFYGVLSTFKVVDNEKLELKEERNKEKKKDGTKFN